MLVTGPPQVILAWRGVQELLWGPLQLGIVVDRSPGTAALQPPHRFKRPI